MKVNKCNNKEEVKIYRDAWGVPHIYAETEIGAIFGQAYAQAEDRLPTILKAYRKAVGRMAEVHGEDWVEHDLKQHQFSHEDAARRFYASMSSEQQGIGKAFIAGLNQYMKDHPEKITSDYLDLEPYHLLALARYSGWDVLLEQAFSDIGTMINKEEVKGSNAWALAGSKTKDGHVITHLDPHVPWQEDWLWHEAHIHGGHLHAYGFVRPGNPYCFFGHNQNISWTITMGTPDVVDVYEVSIHQDKPDYYNYQGIWKKFCKKYCSAIVKTSEGIQVRKKEFYYCEYGPVIKVEGQKAYILREPYGDSFDGYGIWGRINKSSNLLEFKQALNTDEFGPYNLHYGDVDGNIFYIRAGKIPVRSFHEKEFRTFPLELAPTHWCGTHTVDEKAQIENPSCSWYQNCNISPEAVIPNSPLTEKHFPRYLLHGKRDDVYTYFPNGNTPRGLQAFQNLSQVEDMDVEIAMRFVFDSYMRGAELWVQAIECAFLQTNSKDYNIERAIYILKEWDLYARKESVGTTIFSLWWHFMKQSWGDINFSLWSRLRDGQMATNEENGEILKAMKLALEHLRTHFHTIKVPWKEVMVMIRGDEMWPVDGNTFFPLRIISAKSMDKHGRLIADFGQSCPTIVILEKGNVRSYSSLPFGNSEYPESPHFTDQGRLLFSLGKLKDTCFKANHYEMPDEDFKILLVQFPS